MGATDGTARKAPRILKTRKLFKVALDGIRLLHNTSRPDEAWKAFGETLATMGIRRHLVFLVAPSRGGKRRGLELTPEYSAGDEWIESFRSDPAANKALTRRLLRLFRSGRGQMLIPTQDLLEGESKNYRELGVQTVFDIPIRSPTSRFGAVEVDMEDRGRSGKLLDAMLALCDHLATVLERIRLSASVDEANQEAINRGRYIAYEAAAATILHNLKHRMLDYIRSLSARKADIHLARNEEAMRLVQEFEAVIQSWTDATRREFTIHGPGRESTPYPAAEVVGQCIDRNRQTARRRDCRIDLEIESDALVVIGQSILKEILS